MIIEIEEKNYIIQPEENEITVVIEEKPIIIEIAAGSYQGDATSIQGIPVSSHGITNGQSLIFQNNQYIPGNVSAGSSVIEALYEAGETLSGHRLVEIRDNKAYYADFSSLVYGRKIGLTQGAAVIEASINILFFGEISNGSWNFDLTKPIFLGSNGNLTQVMPSSGYLLPVGKPIQTNKLFLDIKEPIKLI